MIYKSSVSLVKKSKLLAGLIFNFSKNQTIAIDQIRNQNLKFDTNDWLLHMYPFYPQIYKKKQRNVYQVSNSSPVISFVFVNKQTDDNIAWENRKSISLKFKDVGMILSAEIRNGKQVNIEVPQISKTNTVDRIKILSLKDMPQQQKMKFNLSSVVDQSRSSSLSKLQNPQKDWEIQALMPYSEYRILYKIIQNSLLDLSGWRFNMEVQKKIQMSKMENKAFDERQVAQLLKNN